MSADSPQVGDTVRLTGVVQERSVDSSGRDMVQFGGRDWYVFATADKLEVVEVADAPDGS